MPDPVLFADGLTWPESPRWHDGCLWVSDVHLFRLVRIGQDGLVTLVAAVPGRPAGMGFMPDGRLLLATALGRTLAWVGADGRTTQAHDLSAMTTSLLNDMVVDGQGRAWVGDTGFVFGSGEAERPGALLLRQPDGSIQVAADDIRFPNGIAVTPDGTRLYLAETFGNRITAFDVDGCGTLSGRRVHANLDSAPDGLCLDADGHLWVPLLFQGEFHRVAPDGRVVERIAFPTKRAISCVLGGSDRRTLFMGVSAVDDSNPQSIVRHGAIYRREVAVAGAGYP